MKIVQSLWSKPAQQSQGANKCGWPDKKYNYFSWALSALQFKKYYNEIELVTDKAGYDLLINKLELPYTSVKVVLDDMNDYPAGLYAIGKILAYSLQETPFIHSDGDVYIWERFSPALERAPLLCQHKEAGGDYHKVYMTVFLEMVQNLPFYPEVLYSSINKNNSIVAVNAGIIGGNNIDFFRSYTKAVFEFVDKNIDHLHKINVKESNIVFEQFLFYAMSEERGQHVSYFKPRFTYFWYDFADYTGIPERIKYIHTPGTLKLERSVAEALEYRVLRDYPEYYYRIMNLIRTNHI